MISGGGWLTTMADIYSIALCAIVVMFGLMVGLAVILIRDQSRLDSRQTILESRTTTELQSFREQVKTFKRESEQQHQEDDER